MFGRTMIAAAAAFALVGASSASAQTIGFKAGASFAKWHTEDEFGEGDTETLTSFMGGGFIRFGMGRIGIQPELLVVTRGGEFEDELSGVTEKIKVDYVEVPLLLILPLSMGTGFAPYVFGGPSFAFEVGCHISEEGPVGDEVEEECSDEGRKSTDLGATAGLGLSFPMGPGELLLEGRYNWGLSNVSDVPGDEIKSRTGAVLAGYSIWIGQR